MMSSPEAVQNVPVKGNTHKKMTFDEILPQIGEYGRYQKRVMIIMSITSACVILQNISPVFTMTIPAHRCKLLDYANDTYEVQDWHHAWLINQTIPVTNEGKYSECTMYSTQGLENTSSETQCSEWVYDKSVFTSTIVSHLHLVCDKKIYRSHSTMMVFAGKFVGAFLNSVAGDYFGRRRVYSVMMLALSVTSVGLVFVSDITSLMALRFLAGATTTGSYLCTYVIAMELTGPSQRRWASIWSDVAGNAVDMLATLFAYLFRDWHHFQASLAAPCIFVIVSYFFLPESPRWLVSKGRLQEAQKVIDDVARVNGVPTSPRLLEGSIATGDEVSGQDVTRKAVSPLGLFRIPRLFVRYTLLYLSWIFTIMCLYGLLLNVSNMSGDIFINFAVMASMSFISIVVCTLLVERMGRRHLLVGLTGFGGLACLSTILPVLLGGSPVILQVLSYVGRMSVTGATLVIYILSPELFPTVLRSFGLGSCSMMSRIGGLASPYIADLNTYVSGKWGKALPQIVFGIAGVATAIIIFILPETTGRHLPETIEDAAHFRRNKSRYDEEQKKPNHL